MAFTEFYCNNLAGGNLNAGSTTDAIAPFAYPGGSWVAATGVFTPASGDPQADGVTAGMFASIHPSGNSVTPFVGRVTSVSSTTITVSLTAKSGTAPTDGTGDRDCKIGGAWQGPNGTSGFPFGFLEVAMTNASGDMPRVNLKNNDTFEITAAMTHAGGGTFQGYTTTIGDGGRCTIDGGTSGASYAMLTASAPIDLRDMIFSNNGDSGTAGGLVLNSTLMFLKRVTVHSVRGIGISHSSSGNNTAAFNECTVYNHSQGGNTAAFSLSEICTLNHCVARDPAAGTGALFIASGGLQVSMTKCIASNGGGDGFSLGGAMNCSMDGCDAYDNAGDGMKLANTSSSTFYITNCNLVKNGGWGINGSGAGNRNGFIANCGFGAGTQVNTSGTTTGLKSMDIAGSVNYADDVTPWTDPASNDFSISLSTAKGAGRSVFSDTGSTVGYPDIGAAQHQDSGGAFPSRGIQALGSGLAI